MYTVFLEQILKKKSLHMYMYILLIIEECTFYVAQEWYIDSNNSRGFVQGVTCTCKYMYMYMNKHGMKTIHCLHDNFVSLTACR